MKRIFVTLFGLLNLSILFAQTEGISINTTGNDPDSSAILDIQSTTKGMLIPRMNSTQRQGITNAALGLLVFDNTTNSFWFYNGTDWAELSGGTQGTPHELSDADQDTRIEVEATPDEDIIRFSVADSEYFQVSPYGLLSEGSIEFPYNGPIPDSGEGVRLMWVPQKVAFRVGYVAGTEWNVSQLGYASAVVGGAFNIASGDESFIGGGNSNNASARFAFIGGGRSSIASGEGAFLGGGLNNTASGVQAFVGGGQTNIASGPGAFVGGGGINTSSGLNAYVGGGLFNTSSGRDAYVGGGTKDTASGDYAFIGGGVENKAQGESSFIGGGFRNKAPGRYSFIGGGRNIEASSRSEVVFGEFAETYTPNSAISFDLDDRLFVIGNGTGPSSRSNALTLLKNGNLGLGESVPDHTLDIVGDMQVSGLSGTGTRLVVANATGVLSTQPLPTASELSDDDQDTRIQVEATPDEDVVRIQAGGVESLSITNDGLFSTGPADSSSDLLLQGPGRRMMWLPGLSVFRVGEAVGTEWDAGNLANNSSVLGGENNALAGSGQFSTIAGGKNNQLSGSFSFMGAGTQNNLMGIRGFIGAGFQNIVSGDFSGVVSGQGNQASGNYASIAGGQGNIASGNASFAVGNENTAFSYAETAIGMFAEQYTPISDSSFEGNDRLFVVGNGINAGNRSNALTILKNGNLGIGTVTPDTTLHIVGGLKYEDGNQAEGYVLTSDVNGMASWQAVSGILQGTNGKDFNLRAAGSRTGLVNDPGDPRGEGSVDLQTFRSFSSEVSSGTYSSIGGGVNNKASGRSTVVSGGADNEATGDYATIGGGLTNTASGPQSTISGGIGHVATGNLSTIPGGIGLEANTFAETVVGMYNQASTGSATTRVGTNPVFVVGNGTSFNARSNAMTILKNGNVGIGTPNPQHLVDLGESTGRKLAVYQNANGTSFHGFAMSSNTLELHAGSNVGGAPLMALKKSGRVGIGTTDPQSKLDVSGGITIGASYAGTTAAPTNGVIIEGNVGIGTDMPTKAKLQIEGTVSSSIGSHAYLINNSNPFGSVTGRSNAGRTTNYSVWANGRIAASEFHAFSDTRIKYIQGISDSETDLSTLMQIEVTDYRLRDSIAKGNKAIKKVIAQQVAEVYPQAVTRNLTEVVPDIYQRAEVQEGWIMLATDLKVGERVKLITESANEVYEVVAVEATRFQVSGLGSPERSEVPLAKSQQSGIASQVFIYGREVDDFHTVDYEALSMLNLSATQEQQHRIEALEAENTALKAQLQALQTLEARLQALEAQLQIAANPTHP